MFGTRSHKVVKLDNLDDLVRKMSDGGGLDGRRVSSNQHDKNRAANHVVAKLRMSDVQMESCTDGHKQFTI